MQDFIDKMHSAVGEDCPLCNQLLDKISHSSILHTPIDFITVDDYVYYPSKLSRLFWNYCRYLSFVVCQHSDLEAVYDACFRLYRRR